jgi:hypothetical protein
MEETFRLFIDTSTAPNLILQDGVKSAASIDKPLGPELEAEGLRTLSLSKCSINPEQTPDFRPGKGEELISS